MKLSEKWLREWVDPAISTDDLLARLTMAGLEVDAVEPVAGSFSHVVVGKVLSVTRHPDAERLNVCQVDVGSEAPLSIVCGATNVHVGMYAPTALVGALLPGGLEIKRAKLRGVESFGMLCSAKELGIVELASGLLELSPDALPGTDIRHYLQLDDVSIEIGLTPNRGDCLSVLGIAREVSVITNAPFKTPFMDADVTPTITDIFPVELAAPSACPRYLARIVRGVNAKARSPSWMQERLQRSGIRSVSALVDITNYVMLELGQPLHVFDKDKLSGGLVVRFAKSDEHITLLDGKNVALSGSTLVIADQLQPLAIAGVMGGADSAVSDATTTIVLEAAFFATDALAGQARHYGLHTDSSHRFERGVDPESPRRAMERATALILAVTGGEAGPVIEANSLVHLPISPSVLLRNDRLRRVLGIEVSADQVSNILSRLGMKVTVREGGWEVVRPSFRFDVAIEADLIEEIARIYGYDNIPAVKPCGALSIAGASEAMLNINRLKDLLVARGYQEAITYSFVDAAFQQRLDGNAPAIALKNPIAADMAVMRTNLWSGLLKAVIYNQNRQQSRLRLFEVGSKFIPQGDEIKEIAVVAGVITGSLNAEQWGLAGTPADFFDIKGDVEALLGLTGRAQRFIFRSRQNQALHPGQSAAIETTDNTHLGWLGALHPELQLDIGLNSQAFVFELELPMLSNIALPRFKEVSKFPALRRDLAIVVDVTVSAEVVQKTIRDAAGALLQHLQLFDVYQGKGIDSGRKSLALGLTLQDTLRTLTDEDVDALIARVLEKLGAELGATLRD